MASQLIKPPETDIQTQHEEGEEAVMGFFDHLEELRTRLFRAVLGIGIGMAISTFFTNQVLNWLRESYGQKFLLIEPTDSVVIFFRVCLFLGAVLASPIITYELLMFILPGLTRKEKRYVFMAMPATTALFLLGLAFTWFFLIPAYVNFLLGFQADVFRPDWTADKYITFVTAVLFWHAAAFETPLIFFVLGRFGMVTATKMLQYWRHAVVASSMIAAFITPTIDPLTMIVITVLLVGLYFLSVVLVALTSGWRRPAARKA